MPYQTVFLYYPDMPGLAHIPSSCTAWLEQRALALCGGARVVRVAATAKWPTTADMVCPIAPTAEAVRAFSREQGTPDALFLDVTYPFVDHSLLESEQGGGSLLDLCGNMAAWREGENIRSLTELRSMRVSSAHTWLLAKTVAENWGNFYYNDDYTTYWQRRTQRKVFASDPTPGEDFHADVFRKAMTHVQNSNGKLLDAGCGHGRMFPVFLREGWQVTGVDISLAAVAGAEVGEVPVSLGSLEATCMPEGAFSFVNAWAVFDSARQNEALHHLMGRLVPGGVLLLTGKNDTYAADDALALAAEKGAASKLFPNGFTHYDTLLSAVAAYGGKVCMELFGPYRGNTATGKAVSIRPPAFYDWICVIRKERETPLLPSRFLLSQPHSATFAALQG